MSICLSGRALTRRTSLQMQRAAVREEQFQHRAVLADCSLAVAFKSLLCSQQAGPGLQCLQAVHSAIQDRGPTCIGQEAAHEVYHTSVQDGLDQDIDHLHTALQQRGHCKSDQDSAAWQGGPRSIA